MKTILVLVHDDAGQASRLTAAQILAGAFGAHLVCLHETIIPEFAGDYALQGGALLCLQEEEREKENGRQVRRMFETAGLDCEWIDVTGFAAQALQQRLGLIDLVISSCRLADALSPDMTRLAEDLLRHGRKPLLLIPADARDLNVEGAAAVAWDGSPQAETALLAALPLLKKAERVSIIHVVGQTPASSAKDAANYLARHDILADVLEIVPDGRSVARALIDAVAEHGASYLVAAAFRRAHTLDLLFGSTTRALIANSSVPLFLAH